MTINADQVASNTRWLRLPDALRHLASLTDEKAAWERLTSRLQDGTLRGKAAVMAVDLYDEDPEIFRDEPITRFTWAMTAHTLVDVESGEVLLHGSLVDDNRPATVRIHGLQLAEDDMVNLLEPKASDSARRRPGRPHGDFWGPFAEELVVFLYQEGLPEADAPLTQVANPVLQRLSDRGFHPNTNTLRDTINAILKRLRDES